MRITRLPVLLAAGLVLAACADDPVTAPDAMAPDAAALATQSAVAETTGNHLIVFSKSAIPAGFADRIAKLGGEVVSTHEAVGAMLVTGVDAAGLDNLSRNRGVKHVEPEPVLYLPETDADLDLESVADATPASPTDPAGAYFFTRQWHMRAIEADRAWEEGYLGSEDVTVAILDTGIDYLHADLEGLVDLDRSISFQPIDDLFVSFYFPTRHPVTDIGYHGTHVAATVASNGYVGAGVTSRTTLMGVKVCSVVLGYCNNIFSGIDHAVENGADIINMSLGGNFQKKDYPGYVSVINRYINQMNREGVLLVVSAGNDAADLDRNIHPNADDVMEHMPSLFKTYCDAPHAVCVSATGPDNYSLTGPWENIDGPAAYTNFGRSAINVAAPGGNGSYVYAACSSSSLVIPNCRLSNGYIVGIRGTSMAAPHATGLAAMIMAEYGTGNPAQTRAMMEQSADDLGQSGTDPYYGKGRINAASAMGLN